MVSDTTTVVLFSFILAVLLVLSILCFVMLSKIDRNRFATLWNITLGSGIAAGFIFILGLILIFFFNRKPGSYSGTNIALSVIATLVIALVAVLMTIVTYQFITDGSYNPNNSSDKSVVLYGLVIVGLSFFSIASIILVSVLIGSSCKCPACPECPECSEPEKLKID